MPVMTPELREELQAACGVDTDAEPDEQVRQAVECVTRLRFERDVLAGTHEFQVEECAGYGWFWYERANHEHESDSCFPTAADALDDLRRHIEGEKGGEG